MAVKLQLYFTQANLSQHGTAASDSQRVRENVPRPPTPQVSQDSDQRTLKHARSGHIMGADEHSHVSKRSKLKEGHARSKQESQARDQLVSRQSSRMVVVPDSESETEPEEYGA